MDGANLSLINAYIPMRTKLGGSLLLLGEYNVLTNTAWGFIPRDKSLLNIVVAHEFISHPFYCHDFAQMDALGAYLSGDPEKFAAYLRNLKDWGEAIALAHQQFNSGEVGGKNVFECLPTARSKRIALQLYDVANLMRRWAMVSKPANIRLSQMAQDLLDDVSKVLINHSSFVVELVASRIPFEWVLDALHKHLQSPHEQIIPKIVEEQIMKLPWVRQAEWLINLLKAGELLKSQSLDHQLVAVAYLSAQLLRQVRIIGIWMKDTWISEGLESPEPHIPFNATGGVLIPWDLGPPHEITSQDPFSTQFSPSDYLQGVSYWAMDPAEKLERLGNLELYDAQISAVGVIAAFEAVQRAFTQWIKKPTSEGIGLIFEIIKVGAASEDTDISDEGEAMFQTAWKSLVELQTQNLSMILSQVLRDTGYYTHIQGSGGLILQVAPRVVAALRSNLLDAQGIDTFFDSVIHSDS